MALGLGVALAGIGALAKGATGIVQGSKANRIDRNNARPTQVVQSEYYQNLAQAEMMAQQGLPAAEYNLAQQNIQRNRNGGLRTLARSANPGAGIASVLRATNDASLRLDVQSGAMRQQNQRGVMQQRQIIAGQKQEAFDWNQKSQYLAKAAQAQALRGAGAQNLMGAFGDATQIGMMMNSEENGGSYSPATGGGFFSAMNKYGAPNFKTSGGVNS